MKKYNKEEYSKYVRELEKDMPGVSPINFKTWKRLQPLADKAVGVSNKIIKNHIIKKEDSKCIKEKRK